MIGSDETNIEAEIVYKAPGGQREPTIEIVEIEENVRGRGGDGEERRGWGGREGRRRGRKRRPGRQKQREEVEEVEDEDEEEDRREKDFRYDKNLFRSPASNRQTSSYLILTLLLPLVFHSQAGPSFY